MEQDLHEAYRLFQLGEVIRAFLFYLRNHEARTLIVVRTGGSGVCLLDWTRVHACKGSILSFIYFSFISYTSAV